MNRMHVIGIMCALRESVAPVPQYQNLVMDIIPHLHIAHLYPKPICEFSLRELLDQLECLQLNWGQVLVEHDQNNNDNNNNDNNDNDNNDNDNDNNNNNDNNNDKDSDGGGGGALELIKACMARLGHIAHHAYPTDGPVLDDPQHTSVLPDTEIMAAATTTNNNNNENNNNTTIVSLSIISRKALRQAICTCFSLLRVQCIVSKAVEIPHMPDIEIKRVNCAMKGHHVESSMDLFNLLQQMVYLAPGMRLVYRTNFAGMYNDVSQVIYFHYPRFCRLPQIPLKDIPNSPHHMLPLISQLIPDISVSYDDDSVIPGLTTFSTEKEKKWVWLICCSEVFLLEVEKAQVWTSSSLAGLVAYFLRENNRRVGNADDEYEKYEDGSSSTISASGSDIYTSHGHLRLIP